MDLTAVFSDDQIAVMGCFVALAACGLVAALSFQFGAAGKSSQQPTGSSVPFQPQAARENVTETKKAA